MRGALAMLIITLLSAASVATAVLLEVKKDADIFQREQIPIPNIQGALDGVSAGGPQTILVLGSDRRFADIKAKNPVRSDTMMLVRLDPSKGATAVMNIPRDLKVTIPGHGADKINAAYAIGGPTLSVKTVRALLHIPINHVVNINFHGFKHAVDRLGCVYVDVDRHYFNDNSPPTAAAAITRRSTCRPATSGSAAPTRWTTSATATSTRISCARRASRTSSARPRTRSA